MQPKDALRWSHQQEVLRQSEGGRQFDQVFTFWVDAAEKLREEDPDFPAYDSLQKALTVTVGEFGAINSYTLADMLMLVINYWAHGEEFAEGMTPIETAFVHEAVFRATERLQEQAESEV